MHADTASSAQSSQVFWIWRWKFSSCRCFFLGEFSNFWTG